MNYYLLTYEEARLCVESNPEMCFFETKHNVDGYDTSVFSYKLAWYDNFSNPVPNRPEIKGNEMRGICFVWNPDGTLYKRYLMLHKFWNIGQIEETLYHNVKKLEIKSMYRKEDGSLIRFIKLPNGNIVPKTKGSFHAPEQLELVRELMITDDKLMNLVRYSLDNDIALFFELVSFKNKIVLDYTETELILLKARYETTGQYIDIDNFAEYGVKTPQADNYTLDEMLALCETMEGIEGWVVHFIGENGYEMFGKSKTRWYRDLHGLLTDSLSREDAIISFIVNETIDDIISLIPVDQLEKLEFVNNLIFIVNRYMSETYKELTKFKHDVFELECNSSMKEFAIKYAKKDRFKFAGIAYEMNGKGDILEYIKSDLLKRAFRLEEARTFIKNEENKYISNG